MVAMKIASTIALFVIATCAHAQVHAQPKPANQITKQDMQVAMEREMHTMDAAAVATCSALHPGLASSIDKRWRDNLAALSPELAEYRKSPAFAKALANAQQEQLHEARKPENQKTLDAMCKGMAE